MFTLRRASPTPEAQLSRLLKKLDRPGVSEQVTALLAAPNFSEDQLVALETKHGVDLAPQRVAASALRQKNERAVLNQLIERTAPFVSDPSELTEFLRSPAAAALPTDVKIRFATYVRGLAGERIEAALEKSLESFETNGAPQELLEYVARMERASRNDLHLQGPELREQLRQSCAVLARRLDRLCGRLPPASPWRPELLRAFQTLVLENERFGRQQESYDCEHLPADDRWRDGLRLYARTDPSGAAELSRTGNADIQAALSELGASLSVSSDLHGPSSHASSVRDGGVPFIPLREAGTFPTALARDTSPPRLAQLELARKAEADLEEVAFQVRAALGTGLIKSGPLLRFEDEARGTLAAFSAAAPLDAEAALIHARKISNMIGALQPTLQLVGRTSQNRVDDEYWRQANQ